MDTTVLVVEDDLEINELLGEYLALENMRYVKAVTGGAGIHLARAEHPDAIILDLMLPDVDGFEVARQLTGKRSTFDIPVIILSCMCQQADKEKGYASGALFYLSKPFLPDDLLATVRQALQWHAGLRTRPPVGEFWLGGSGGEKLMCAKGTHQMVADLLARTDLEEAAVEQMRAAMETLHGWAADWQAGHPGAGRVRVAYAIDEEAVTWTLSEETPGLLADAFFKTAPRTSGGIGAGLMGWGGANKTPANVAVPPPWKQVLIQTGAARFERDVHTRQVRFVRGLGAPMGVVPAATEEVPVVELAGGLGGGMLVPTNGQDRTLTPAANGAK